LGEIPVNALAVLGFFILGFGHPGFWLLGLGLETAFLYTLATNKRFQRLVDAKKLVQLKAQAETKKQDLVGQLGPEARRRLVALEEKCGKIIRIHQKSQIEAFTLETNRDALNKLLGMYLKLLVAQHNLESMEVQTTEDTLRHKIANLERDLQNDKMSPSVKESKTATLKVLQKRLENLEHREQVLQEIDSDLTRIEAQVELAMENVTIRGRPQIISANIDLVSNLLDDTLYGESGSNITGLEETFG
jgi:hypothetical protein